MHFQPTEIIFSTYTSYCELTLLHDWFPGEWVNEWNVTNGSQKDYQDFGRAQLEVYNAASFGWSYWTLKNDRKHWDFEWNIRNHYLQLGNV